MKSVTTSQKEESPRSTNELRFMDAPYPGYDSEEDDDEYLNENLY